MYPFLAHSANPKLEIPEQSYSDHVLNVALGAEERARECFRFWAEEESAARFICAIRAAGEVHDLGKMYETFQQLLRGVISTHGGFRHEDAGAAFLADRSCLAACLVYAHHQGLTDWSAESIKGEIGPYRIPEEAVRTSEMMHSWLEAHKREGLPAWEGELQDPILNGTGFPLRLALSCLVDADHSDTAQHYKQEVEIDSGPTPRWEERLAKLEQYVSSMPAGECGSAEAERNNIRRHVFHDAYSRPILETALSCDSPVGTGKTTAIMAHLLQAAIKRKSRHIFVVLPYTNIIRQSVRTYRNALVLNGEDASAVVAEHHHLADFSSPEERQYATLWNAPIIVTTAVQFFGTLASHQTSRLRKLHQLPGSAVFFDEIHAALPAKLWPLAWRWLREASDQWGCHFVYASGSLPPLWKMREIVGEDVVKIPPLLKPETAQASQEFESRRVRYFNNPKHRSLSCDALADAVLGKPGPRLVILNTIQTAAVFADYLRHIRNVDVLHISTALTPRDREAIIDRVIAKLLDPFAPDWVLVATSCVEAGVDFSFRSAFRERASAASLLQTAGRVNRNGEYNAQGGGKVFDVTLDDRLFKVNKGLGHSIQALSELFREGRFEEGSGETPSSLMELAIKRELASMDPIHRGQGLLTKERILELKYVGENFRVIDSESVVVVVDKSIVERIRSGQYVSPTELVRGSVSLRPYRQSELALSPIILGGDLLEWRYEYDGEFLGIIEGIKDLIKAQVTRGASPEFVGW